MSQFYHPNRLSFCIRSSYCHWKKWVLIKKLFTNAIFLLTLRKKCPYSEFFWPSFPTFRLNTERYSVSLSIQSECGKMRTKIISNMGAFHAVWMFYIRSVFFHRPGRETYCDFSNFFSDHEKWTSASAKMILNLAAVCFCFYFFCYGFCFVLHCLFYIVFVFSFCFLVYFFIGFIFLLCYVLVLGVFWFSFLLLSSFDLFLLLLFYSVLLGLHFFGFVLRYFVLFCFLFFCYCWCFISSSFFVSFVSFVILFVILYFILFALFFWLIFFVLFALFFYIFYFLIGILWSNMYICIYLPWMFKWQVCFEELLIL